MLVLFACSVVVQFNDPDPFGWVALYAAAAGACALSLGRRLRWWFPAVVAAAALVWASTIAPRVVGIVPFLEMFGAFEMKSVAIEESRELYGLALTAGWMAVLSVRTARRAGRRTTASA
jgi:hypothetical protein